MAQERAEEAQQQIERKVEILVAPGATSEDIAAVYDEWANQFSKDLTDAGYAGPTKLASIFKEVCLDKNAAVVDWGSGTGLAGEQLHSCGYTNIIAVDISQKSLDVAFEKGVYKKVVKLGDSKELFKDDEFDALVCAGCIAPNHVMPDTFYEWVRIVKPGGLIGISMRKAFIELCEGEESNFTEELKMKFEKVIGDLKSYKQWEMISRTEFSGYIGPDMLGLIYIFKVI